MDINMQNPFACKLQMFMSVPKSDRAGMGGRGKTVTTSRAYSDKLLLQIKVKIVLKFSIGKIFIVPAKK